MQGIDAGIGQVALAGLQSSQPDQIEAILAALLNEIATVPDDFVLVLDDYHVITTDQVHEALNFFIDHLPPKTHLLIISRADPPLRLSRMRGRGHLAEIRATDLRFKGDEVNAFLNDLMRLDLSREDVISLETRTEGWVAGLHLAGLSLQGRTDKSRFIDAFTGSQRSVFDYLTDEVLTQQTDQRREFLLRTSILTRMSGPLCDAVTGQSDGQETLEQLEGENLLIVQLDEERRWYRYHHLFGSLLRHYLHREIGEQGVRLLQQKACDWFARNELPEEAFEHALEAEDFDRAADLTEQNAWPMMKRGQLSVSLRWFGELPAELVRIRPRLGLTYARALMASLQMGDVEPYLRDAEKALESAPDADLLGEIDAMRGFITRIHGDIPGAIELDQRALERISEDNLDILALVTWDLGMSYALTDDLPAASKAFAEASSVSQKNDNILLAMYPICWLAEVYVDQGNLHEAVETYQRALRVATEWETRGEALPLAVGMAYGGLSQIYREWNDLAKATELALKAIELGELGGPMDNLMRGYLALARIKQAQGGYHRRPRRARGSRTDRRSLEDLSMDRWTSAIPSPTLAGTESGRVRWWRSPSCGSLAAFYRVA